MYFLQTAVLAQSALRILRFDRDTPVTEHHSPTHLTTPNKTVSRFKYFLLSSLIFQATLVERVLPSQTALRQHIRSFKSNLSNQVTTERLQPAMANPSQYFLLADHIKLSLLERQRAISLNLEPTSQDGHISRSLESLREGLEKVEAERIRLEEAGDTS
jgi:hypothetical protein